MVNPVPRRVDFLPVSIASGDSISSAVSLVGLVPCGVYMPSAWTVAGLSFQVSADGVTWQEAQRFDNSGAYLLTVTVDQFLPLDPACFAGGVSLKVRSGTVATPVAQGAARTLTLAVWRF